MAALLLMVLILISHASQTSALGTLLVICEPNVIQINVQLNESSFFGIVHTRPNRKTCAVWGTGQNSLRLYVPLTQPQMNDCGVVQTNGFYTAVVDVRRNHAVDLLDDSSFLVQCAVQKGPAPLNTPSVTPSPLVQENEVNLLLLQNDLPVTESMVGNRYILELTVPDVFRYHVTSCAAFTGEDTIQFIPVIDQLGCPVDGSTITPFARVYDQSKFRSELTMFRFNDSNQVYVQCSIEKCPDVCPQRICEPRTDYNVLSLHRVLPINKPETLASVRIMVIDQWQLASCDQVDDASDTPALPKYKMLPFSLALPPPTKTDGQDERILPSTSSKQSSLTRQFVQESMASGQFNARDYTDVATTLGTDHSAYATMNKSVSRPTQRKQQNTQDHNLRTQMARNIDQDDDVSLPDQVAQLDSNPTPSPQPTIERGPSVELPKGDADYQSVMHPCQITIGTRANAGGILVVRNWKSNESTTSNSNTDILNGGRRQKQSSSSTLRSRRSTSSSIDQQKAPQKPGKKSIIKKHKPLPPCPPVRRDSLPSIKSKSDSGESVQFPSPPPPLFIHPTRNVPHPNAQSKPPPPPRKPERKTSQEDEQTQTGTDLGMNEPDVTPHGSQWFMDV